jgi:hypothetical protein
MFLARALLKQSTDMCCNFGGSKPVVRLALIRLCSIYTFNAIPVGSGVTLAAKFLGERQNSDAFGKKKPSITRGFVFLLAEAT